MENTMDFSNKKVQAVTLAVMNHVLASEANGNTMDDVYATLGKYVQITREQFEDYYKQASETLSTWKTDGSLSTELSDEELEMVAGGSVGSFFSEIGNGLATAACAVGNFVKEHGVEIAIVAAFVLAGGAAGAAIGYGIYCAVLAEIAVSATVGGAVVGGVLGGISSHPALRNYHNK